MPTSPSPIDRSRPLPPSLSVRAGLAAYLAENGFTTAGYTADTFDVDAFGRHLVLRNPPDRKWAIPLHDLHHVATGYGTDLVGEAEIGAWELTGGCRTPIVYVLNLGSVLLSLFTSPRRLFRAFRDARGARALYRTPHDYEAILAMSVGELRALLGIPAEGLAREPRRLHETAEAAAAEGAAS